MKPYKLDGLVTEDAYIARNEVIDGEYDFESALELYPASILNLFGERVNPSPWNTRPEELHVFNMNDINVDGDSIAVNFSLNLDETFPDRPGGMFDMLNVLPGVSVLDKYINFETSYRFAPNPLEFRRVFTGWTLDQEGREPFDPREPINEKTTVYAQWLENHTVRFMSNYPGSNTNPFATVTIPNGQSIDNNAIGTIMPTHPIRVGYALVGWDENPMGEDIPFTPDTTINNDMTVYAQWSPNEIRTITFDLAGGNIEGVPANVERQVRDGQSISNATAPPINNTMPDEPTRLGFIFDDWEVTTSDVTDVDIEQIFTSEEIHTQIITGGNITITARWRADPAFLNVSVPTNVFFQSNHIDETELESQKFTITNNSIVGVHVDVDNFTTREATGKNLITNLDIVSTKENATPVQLITNGTIEQTLGGRLLSLPGDERGNFSV